MTNQQDKIIMKFDKKLYEAKEKRNLRVDRRKFFSGNPPMDAQLELKIEDTKKNKSEKRLDHALDKLDAVLSDAEIGRDRSLEKLPTKSRLSVPNTDVQNIVDILVFLIKEQRSFKKKGNRFRYDFAVWMRYEIKRQEITYAGLAKQIDMSASALKGIVYNMRSPNLEEIGDITNALGFAMSDVIAWLEEASRRIET